MKSIEEKLYEQHHRRLYGICLRIIGRPQEAEEAMHDAFIKIFDNLDRLKSDEAFVTWSRNIAVRTAIDRTRVHRWSFEPLDGIDIADEEPDEMPELTVEMVKQALAVMPDGYRIILSLRLFDELTFDEIAAQLNITPSTVRSQFARGRAKLAHEIKKKWS